MIDTPQKHAYPKAHTERTMKKLTKFTVIWPDRGENRSINQYVCHPISYQDKM